MTVIYKGGKVVGQLAENVPTAPGHLTVTHPKGGYQVVRSSEVEVVTFD